MPPKRKRAENSVMAGTTSTRATRASTRSTNIGASGSSTAKETNEAGDGQAVVETPPVKKTKTTKTTKSTASTGRSNKQAGERKPSASSSKQLAEKSSAGKSSKFDDDIAAQKVIPQADAPIAIKEVSSAPVAMSEPPQVQAPPPFKTTYESYSVARSKYLFQTYADSDAPELIGPEGFQRLCADSDIPLEGPLPLILAWQLGTKEMMKIKEDEWRRGTEMLKISNLRALSLALRDLEGVLILNNHVPGKTSKKEAYDKTEFRKLCADSKASFRALYSFCFTLVKPEQSKNIDMETASALWSVLLMPKYPLMGEVVDFINERLSTYKAANKDLWSMMLEFCETVNPNLSDYESDGAWPTLLDNFVQWKKGPARSVNE